MSVLVGVNGTDWPVPEDGDTGWGNSLRAYFYALNSRKTGSFQFGIEELVGGSNPGYLFPGHRAATIGSTEVFVRVPAAGRLTKIIAQIENPCDGVFSFRVRKNGVNTALFTSILESQTGSLDVDISGQVPVTVAAGDKISVVFDDQGGAGLPSGNCAVAIGFQAGGG